jgi:hypothetical protein
MGRVFKGDAAMMDNMQTARMIEWLDEERRRDKAMISQLEERTNQQQELMEQMKRHINGLENDIAGQRAQFMPANRDQELMALFRKEVSDMIESLEARRLTAEREADRRQEIAREGIMVPIRNVEERQERLEDSIRDVLGARSERDRMTAAIAAIQQRVEDVAKKIEEPERRVILLEEQRRQDSRRLSDVQTTLPEISKALEQLSMKGDLIEGLTKSNEKRILELQTSESERREEIQQFLDQQNLITQQRDIQINDLRNRVTSYDEEMRRNLERFESWAETHRQMRKIVEDFERIGERLDRRINEVAEMQRLSEERFRTEWNDWISDDQIRWKEFTVSNDESWRIHGKEMQELRGILKELHERFDPMRANVDRLWKLQRAQADLYRERYQALLIEYDKPEDNAPVSSTTLSANGH